jgi:hypothetical protein
MHGLKVRHLGNRDWVILCKPEVMMSSAKRRDVRSVGGPFRLASRVKFNCARWRMCDPSAKGHANVGGLKSIGGKRFHKTSAYFAKWTAPA